MLVRVQYGLQINQRLSESSLKSFLLRRVLELSTTSTLLIVPYVFYIVKQRKIALPNLATTLIIESN